MIQKKLFFILYIGIALIIYNGCSDSSLDLSTKTIVPEFLSVQIDSNEFNSLSASIRATVSNAEKLYIKFSSDSVNYEYSPIFSITANEVEIPLLGLKPNTTYSVNIIAISSTEDTARSEMVNFTSGDLPLEIPDLTIEIFQNLGSEFVLFGLVSQIPNSKGYCVIINNNGDIVWYREFASPVVDFQKQKNGNYTVFSSDDGSPPHFYEMDQLGRIIHEFEARPGFTTDSHELRLIDGGYCLFSLEFREMDLTEFGGYSNASVRGTGIELFRLGKSPFYWSPFDHFLVTDATYDIPLNTQNVNPWHGNAIEIDTDGNLLISFRNCDEITKIDSYTGEVLWRLGGENNEFTFINDPLGGFSHQHGIRRLKNGNILMFDNGNLHSPPVSRAVEYALNEQTKIAEMVWNYTHTPAIFGFALGFAHRISNGNTLINYGTAQKIIEVDMAGNKLMEITIQDTNYFAYRAFEINSIY